MKTDKLYTVNKHNKRIFASGGTTVIVPNFGVNPYSGQVHTVDFPSFSAETNPSITNTRLDTSKVNLSPTTPTQTPKSGAGVASAVAAGLGFAADAAGYYTNEQNKAKSKIDAFNSRLNGFAKQEFTPQYSTDAFMSMAENTQMINPNITSKQIKTYDLGGTLGLAAKGAGAGAVIGSVVPGIGTAIGAAGGAIVGGITGIASWLSGNSKYNKAADAAVSKANLINQQNMLSRHNAALGTMQNQSDLLNSEYYAFGGPITGAIDYDNMMSYLSLKQQQIDNQKFACGGHKRAFGGDIMTNGATWDTGFSFVGNGGSHESNPYEGIQVGVDPEGTPNLVEEGEVIWNDYVFSRRLKVPNSFKKKYKLKEGGSLSFAEAAQKFFEENKERPNDPISKRGRDSLLTALMDQQEQVRTKKQQKEAAEQFSMLPPEEQMGIMQMAQQGAAQGAPEEGINTEEGMMNEQVPFMGAYGGELLAEGGELGNLFKGKGKKPNKLIRKYNRDWFDSRAKALGFELGDRFNFSNTDSDLNLTNFNNLYRDYQRQKAYDTYLNGQRQSWINQELASGRYRRGDDGKAVYKAQLYGDNDLGKDWISSTGDRISAEEYTRKKDEYNQLVSKGELTPEEKAKVDAFTAASYRNRPVVKGQFAKDYNGDIMYDYGTDVSSTWVPNNDVLGKDFKWKDSDAARISYDPNNKVSPASYLRYVPAFGGAIGLFSDMFSSPDYGRALEIKNAGTYNVPTVKSTPVGNYLSYRPMDLSFYSNKLASQTGATSRAIMNSTNGNAGQAMAGLLALDNSSNNQMGNLFRNAEEYNLGQRAKIGEFNRGTNMFNSQQELAAERANQIAQLQGKRDAYQGIVTGNTLMDQIDARRSAGMSANFTNLFNSLGQIGEEAYDQDRINALIQRDIIKDVYNSAACGGMLTKSKRRKK